MFEVDNPSIVEYLARRPLITSLVAPKLQDLGANDFTFTVLTYNILAQSHIKRSFFPYCSKEVLRWNFRSKLLMLEISAYDADIMCFQEMDRFPEFFAPFLKSRGYAYECFFRSGPSGDVNCVAWKESKFSLFDEKKISFEEITKGRGCTRNVSQVVALCAQSCPSVPIIIATTHLYWREDCEHIRIAEAHLLLSEIQLFRQKLGPCFLIVAGDLNSDPKSILMQNILRTNTGWDDLETLKWQLPKEKIYAMLTDVSFNFMPLRSAYQIYPFLAHSSNSYPLPYTTFCLFKGVLDYILYCPEPVNNYFLVPEAVRTLPEQRILEQEVGLPNHIYASDHLALECKFRIFKNSPQSLNSQPTLDNP